jgi:hypothetical protein
LLGSTVSSTPNTSSDKVSHPRVRSEKETTVTSAVSASEVHRNATMPISTATTTPKA